MYTGTAAFLLLFCFLNLYICIIFYLERYKKERIISEISGFIYVCILYIAGTTIVAYDIMGNDFIKTLPIFTTLITATIVGFSAYITYLKYRATLLWEYSPYPPRLVEVDDNTIKIDIHFVFKNVGREPLNITNFSLIHTNLTNDEEFKLEVKGRPAGTSSGPSGTVIIWQHIIFNIEHSLKNMIVGAISHKKDFWIDAIETVKDKVRIIFLKIEYEGLTTQRKDCLFLILSFIGVKDGIIYLRFAEPKYIDIIKNKFEHHKKTKSKPDKFYEIKSIIEEILKRSTP